MKKVICFILFTCITFVQCSRIDSIKTVETVNFSNESDAFGRAVAQELDLIVRSMHANGADYSETLNTEQFNDQFYSDFVSASGIAQTKSGNDFFDYSFECFLRAQQILTKIQIEFIEKIIVECMEGVSYPDIQSRLISLYNEVINQVPSIQQERIVTVISTFYYCFDVLQQLEDSGVILMTPTQVVPAIQTKSEDSSWESCRKILATAWVIAVGEPTPAGEIVASVMTVYISGQLLYEVLLCRESSYEKNRKWCIEKYVECKEHASLYTHCDDCLQYCIQQYTWPYQTCNW